MPIAANSPTDRADQLTVLTERLTAILESEIVALMEKRPAVLADHAPERDKLAAVYAQEMALIRKDNRLIKGADGASLVALKSATARFRDVQAAHGQRLSSIRMVTEGLLKAVAEDANAKTQAVTGYGQDAGLRQTAAGAPASLTLNQVV